MVYFTTFQFHNSIFLYSSLWVQFQLQRFFLLQTSCFESQVRFDGTCHQLWPVYKKFLSEDTRSYHKNFQFQSNISNTMLINKASKRWYGSRIEKFSKALGMSKVMNCVGNFVISIIFLFQEKHPFSINHYFFTSQLLNLMKNGKGRIRIIRREQEKNK